MRKILTAVAVAVVLACPAVRAQGPAYGDSPAAFLAMVNQYRAFHGRPPLAWDANLAAFASRNTGIHAPGSSGGGAQTWAGFRSYTQAFHAWASSPAHAAIMLSASGSVGISFSPSGTTANFR